MKNFQHIKWIVTFIVVLLMADRAGGLALQALLKRSHFRFVDLYEGRIDAKVLGMGDSRGVNMIFAGPPFSGAGIEGYNLSFNGMSPLLAEVLFLDYLDRSSAPDLVLINVTLADKAPLNVSMVREYKYYLPYSRRLANLMQADSPGAYAGTRFSHLFRYNSRQFLRALYYLGRSDQNWGNGQQIGGRLMDEIDNMDPVEMTANAESLAAIRNIIAAAKARDIPVRLVLMPFYQPYLEKITNLATWKMGIEAELALKIWDFSSAVEGDSLFANSIHVNLRGRERLALKMIRDGLFAVERE